MANCLTKVGFAKRSPQNFLIFAFIIFELKKFKKLCYFYNFKIRAFLTITVLIVTLYTSKKRNAK